MIDMSDRTSFDVSEQLAIVRFDDVAGQVWDSVFWLSKDGKHLATIEDGPVSDRTNPYVPSYCTDVLLHWLLKLDRETIAKETGLQTLSESGKYGCVQTTLLNSGEYDVMLYRPIQEHTTAAKLADALGTCIVQVLKSWKKP